MDFGRAASVAPVWSYPYYTAAAAADTAVAADTAAEVGLPACPGCGWSPFELQQTAAAASLTASSSWRHSNSLGNTPCSGRNAKNTKIQFL